jgi:hypothetical protein
MMEKLQNEYPERRDELLNLLGVDLQVIAIPPSL